MDSMAENPATPPPIIKYFVLMLAADLSAVEVDLEGTDEFSKTFLFS
jgi:hypothetical protein